MTSLSNWGCQSTAYRQRCTEQHWFKNFIKISRFFVFVLCGSLWDNAEISSLFGLISWWLLMMVLPSKVAFFVSHPRGFWNKIQWWFTLEGLGLGIMAFKIYNATSKGTFFANSCWTIVFGTISSCSTCANYQVNTLIRFGGMVLTLGKQIKTCHFVLTFSENLKYGHFTSQI